MIGAFLAETRSGGIGGSMSLKNMPKHLQSLFGGSPTNAGVSVNEEKSLTLPVVWSCVSILARTTASLPLLVYDRIDERNKKVAFDNPLYKLLHSAPNSEQTSYDWRVYMSLHQNLWGAGISEIEFDRNGQPIALWPIPAWRAKPARTKSGSLVYQINMPDGTQRVLQQSQCVVFQSMSTSRDRWMSPIQVHRETIGAAIGVKEFGARTFGQGVNPAGILSGINFGKEESQKTLRAKYGGYEGLGEAHKLMFIEEGTKFEKVGLPPEDAQYLQTRQLDVAEVSRIYHVPLFLVNETSKSTSWGTGLEEQKNAFLEFTMVPILVQWEQELNKKLFYNNDVFTEFLVNGLLRANVKDRFQAYKDGFSIGMYSIDEIRAMENLNALGEGIGKERFMPLNMSTVQNIVDGNGKETNTTNGDSK